ncbi:MAG: peptidylprolyl isomerase [Myxococcaceae bacterium]
MNEHFSLRRIFSYIFIGAIAFLFALQWGPGSKGCNTPLTHQSTEAAATVNGQEIPLADFRREYANQLAYLREQNITESLAQQLGIPRQVLDRLVNTELLAQAAEKEGLSPSDEELRAIIHKNADFQKDGKFDFDRYREVLRDFYRRTDVDFEADMRRKLAAQKLLDLVEASAVVSDDEVKAKFMKDGNKAAATFARFLPAMYADKVPAPKPEELTAFTASHPKEIADYYEANRFLYQQAERVKARHILIKVDADAPKEAKDEARLKALNIKKELDAGKDFAELAKQFSEDPGSKESGGDLGFNERGAWVPAFSDAAFALKAGEVSAPVETQFGLHLIKVEEKKPPEKKELKDVEGEIAKQLYSKQKAKELAEAEAAKALEAVKAGKGLAELFPAEKEKEEKPAAMRFQAEARPTATDTGEFSSSTESVPQLGPAPELVKDIFAAAGPGPLAKVYSAGEGFTVVVVTDRKRPSEPDFTAQKDTLKIEAIKGKQYELRDAYLKALKNQAQIVTNEGAIASTGNPADSEG